MDRIISSKIVALTFGILVISFLTAFYVVAWQEPSQPPPGGNVPTPLNTGPEVQSKIGGLILNTGGGGTGLKVEKGNVCIGSDCRDKWPETGVVTTYRLEASGYKTGNKYYGKSVSYSCPEGSNVVNVQLSTRNVMLQNSSGGGCTWGCWSGDDCGRRTANSCSYSISGTKVTLTASIVQTYEVDCSCCRGYSLTTYCYPHVAGRWGYPQIDCSLPGGSPQCSLEFQCGTKQTVSQ